MFKSESDIKRGTFDRISLRFHMAHSTVLHTIHNTIVGALNPKTGYICFKHASNHVIITMIQNHPLYTSISNIHTKIQISVPTQYNSCINTLPNTYQTTWRNILCIIINTIRVIGMDIGSMPLFSYQVTDSSC